MVINSLESDEATLPLSAAQGKVLATDKQSKTDNNLDTIDKTIVGAINEIYPKATGVGMIDPESGGTGEIFNLYKGSYRNIASAMCSHAEGEKTTASGQMSHAEGRNTIASGYCSHAEGSGTEAMGSYSHSEGVATIANNSGEHAEGFNNVSNTGETNNLRTRHSVGIGISSTNRMNAHEIMANGDHYIYGLGGYDGTNAISEDSKTLQEVINSKQATITAGTGLEFEGNILNVTLDTTVFKVVSVLPDSPAVGDENKIHLVPAESTGANNAYTEYVWVNSAWEILGEYTSDVDLTLSNLGISATAAEINKLDGLATTATELGYVHGVTSNIQTQLNAKANTSSLSSYALKSGSNASGTWPISISGNAATATKLAAARLLWGRSFDGSGNVSGDMIGVGRINNGLIISQFGTSADNSDTTRFLINGHQLEFGGYGYAHQVYYFRPQYSANGETYADMYIQNASASDSPVFSTTHCFDHNGNAYH